MSKYDDKKQARIERYARRAARAQQRSDQAYERASSIGSAIPMGQPILVGHHSEGRHRRDLQRIDDSMRRSVEESEKAAHWADRAASAASNTAIESDDPDAIEKLRVKLARCEAAQQKMKDSNAALRKNDDDALRALGLSEAQIAELKKPDFMGRVGFPAYCLSNNSAEIRRIKTRIEQLTARRAAETKTLDMGAVSIIDNVEENRTQIIFPDKPGDTVRAFLKSRGFRWAPSNGAWQRHRSPAANDMAQQAAKLYNEQ